MEICMKKFSKNISKRIHKLYKRDGRYACDGCYGCISKCARWSKRERTTLNERFRDLVNDQNHR